MILRDKNIFYLINSLNKGGAERQVLELQKSFGGQIIIIENTVKFDLPDSIKIHVLNNKATASLAIKFLRYFKSIFRLYRILKNNNNCKKVIVVSFLEQSNVLNVITSFFSKHETVLSARINLNIQYGKNPWFLFIIKILYRFSNMVTANSKGLVNQLINDFNLSEKKVKYVSNAYDILLIRSKSEEIILDINLEKLILKSTYMLSVNRLEEQKLVDKQINIFTEVKHKKEGIKLIVAGEGPLKNYLVNYAKAKGNLVFDYESGDQITNSFDIYFVGIINNPYRMYKFASAFILTSKYESMPNTLIEALICKAPVFASDCFFGPREVLRIGEPNYAEDLGELSSDDIIGTLLPIPINEFQPWIKPLLNQLKSGNQSISSSLYDDKISSFDHKSAMQRWNEILSVI